GELDHLLDGRVREIEQRQGRVGGRLGRLLLGRLVLLFLLGRFGLGRHRVLLEPDHLAARAPAARNGEKLSPSCSCQKAANRSAVWPECIKRSLTLFQVIPPGVPGQAVIPKTPEIPCSSLTYRSLQASQRTPRLGSKPLDRGLRSVKR